VTFVRKSDLVAGGWANGPAGGTEIDEAALDELEQRIYDAVNAGTTVIKTGFGAPTGLNAVGLYEDMVTPTTPRSLWTQYWDGKLVTFGGGSTNGSAKRAIFNVGTGDYIIRDNESSAYVRGQPASGTRKQIRFSLQAEFVDGGHWGTLVNEGPGAWDVIKDVGVTLLPAGSWTIPPGAMVDWVCLAPAIFVIRGATAVQTSTAPTVQTPPHVTISGTTFTTTLGAWTPTAGTTYAIRWYRDGVVIGGQTASTYAYNAGTDAGHAISSDVIATNNGASSSASASDNSITVQPSGASSFATNFPRWEMAEDRGTIQGVSYAIGSVPTLGVEVGWKVRMGWGSIGGSPSPTTQSAEYFNRGADASILSRGTDVFPGPWEYTTVDGDSGTGGNETIFARGTIGNGTGTPVTADTPDLPVLPVGTLTGGGGSNPGGGRDAALQPFAVGSPWNLAVGSAAAYSATTDAQAAAMRSGGSYYLNAQYYSIPVIQSVASDPLCTFTGGDAGTVQIQVPTNNVQIANGTDGVMVVVDPAKVWEHEFWQVTHTGGTNFTYSSYTKNKIDETGWGCGPLNSTHLGGISASDNSLMGGLIRQWETAAGSINHALAAAIPPSKLSRGPIFPAVSEDSDTSGYTGSIKIGTQFAIPPGVNIDALVSTVGGRMLGHCLQDYGVYVGDKGSQTIIPAEPSLEGTQVLSEMRAAIATLMAQVVRITNQSASAIAGGGTSRRQPDRPTIGSAGPATRPSVDIDHTYVGFAAGSSESVGTTWGHTVSLGSNKLYLAVFKPSGDSTVVGTPTFGGQPLTLLDTVTSPAGGTARRIEVWYRKGVPSGNQLLSYTMSTSNGLEIEQYSFSDVNQTATFGTVVKDFGATKTALSVAVSATGALASDLVFATFHARATNAVPTGMTVGSGQTKIGEGLVGANNLGATTTKIGAAAAVVTSTASFTPAAGGGGDHASAMAFTIRLA
jgi:hypothetical protein